MYFQKETMDFQVQWADLLMVYPPGKEHAGCMDRMRAALPFPIKYSLH